MNKYGSKLKKLGHIPHAYKRRNEQPADGKRNPTVCVPNFRELSLFTPENAVPTFQKAARSFAEKALAHKAKILAANSATMGALTSFRTHLKKDLPKIPHADFAVDKITYDAMLKGEYLRTNYNSDTLYRKSTNPE